jgi:hypothetical protein
LADPLTVKVPPLFTISPYFPAVFPYANTKSALILEGMGEASVPMSKVPPLFTVMLPPTKVNVLDTTRLKLKVPLIVVVLATALVSIVTVCPAWIVTVLQALGTNPKLQV